MISGFSSKFFLMNSERFGASWELRRAAGRAGLRTRILLFGELILLLDERVPRLLVRFLGFVVFDVLTIVDFSPLLGNSLRQRSRPLPSSTASVSDSVDLG